MKRKLQVNLSKIGSREMPSFRDFKYAMEECYFTHLLRLAEGNVSAAARIAKKDRKDLYEALERNNISAQDFR